MVARRHADRLVLRRIGRVRAARARPELGEIAKIPLGASASFFYSPVWSPDGKNIAFTDKRLHLWYVNLENRSPLTVDTDYYETLEKAVEVVLEELKKNPLPKYKKPAYPKYPQVLPKKER